MVGGKAEGVDEVRDWGVFGDVELVLAGVAIVVVLYKGHEDGRDESEAFRMYLSIEKAFEEGDNSLLHEFEPSEDEAHAPTQQHSVQSLKGD